MTLIITFIVGFILSLLANYLSPSFKRIVDNIFSWTFHLLDKDRFDLTGKWQQIFREPKSGNPIQCVETKEIVHLKHLGNKISGSGTTQDNHRQFLYDLTVQHNLVYGFYEKIGERGNITGKGVNQMIVSPDRLQMNGQATWFDHDTNKIESSEIIWKKQ